MEPFPFDSDNFNESLIALYKEVFQSLTGRFARIANKIKGKGLNPEAEDKEGNGDVMTFGAK
jgi:hypothetical protein